MSEVGENRPKRAKTGGRKRGTPNVLTRDVRGALAALEEANLHRLQSWLNEVGKTDPAKAIDLVLRLLEFVVPKPRSDR